MFLLSMSHPQRKDRHFFQNRLESKRFFVTLPDQTRGLTLGPDYSGWGGGGRERKLLRFQGLVARMHHHPEDKRLPSRLWELLSWASPFQVSIQYYFKWTLLKCSPITSLESVGQNTGERKSPSLTFNFMFCFFLSLFRWHKKKPSLKMWTF